MPFTICLKVSQSTKKAKWLTYNQYNGHSLQVLGWDDCSLKSFVPKKTALLGILSPRNLQNGYEEYHIWLYIPVVKTTTFTILLGCFHMFPFLCDPFVGTAVRSDLGHWWFLWDHLDICYSCDFWSFTQVFLEDFKINYGGLWLKEFGINASCCQRELP